MANKILISVDMDEWYQCRWATGSDFSIWKDTKTCFMEYYKSDRPKGEIIPLAHRILKLFADYDIKATFFFTGEIATYYPDLVKEISEAGHEIGSHNFVHKDYNLKNRKEFYDNLKRSKILLKRLSGQEIIGYRAPNSTVNNYMIKDLLKLKFRYDSSITPTRKLMGKFGHFVNAPINPYMLDANDFGKRGTSGLWEFPWPVFPVMSLPSGSGIMTRIAGYNYTKAALDHALKTGDSVYYFHPYEIGSYPNLKKRDVKTRIFLRNLGSNYYRMLKKLIARYNGRFISGREMLKRHAKDNF